GGVVQNRRLKTSRPIANRHQTSVPSQNIRVVSAPAGHRVLVSMVPLVACAIRVSNALPEAWLNNQAYQNVTAMVARVSIGLDPNWGITTNGICQMVTPMAISTVAANGVRVDCSLGWAQARKLASSGSWALRGLTMFMAIAIGRPYQTLNSAIFGTGAPKAVCRPIAANVTASGTASASAYQIQLT